MFHIVFDIYQKRACFYFKNREKGIFIFLSAKIIDSGSLTERISNFIPVIGRDFSSSFICCRISLYRIKDIKTIPKINSVRIIIS